MSKPLPTLEIPAGSVEYVGAPVWGKDDETAIDVTTMTARLALIEKTDGADLDGDGQTHPIESDWTEGVWHKRSGDTYADALIGDDFTLVAGKTYALFVQASGVDEQPYRHVGWIRAV